ncbi:hypothetical protein B0A49_02516 [Cryomyces minteri]|uniref:Uncharacterized protein n=1 Tax=Cryomyces minteri TaxID=331657 RepID=A0A4U0XQV1_9PEZI|nr:hypothetical protein B0A49_02516 [Cryomyces minteri]
MSTHVTLPSFESLLASIGQIDALASSEGLPYDHKSQAAMQIHHHQREYVTIHTPFKSSCLASSSSKEINNARNPAVRTKLPLKHFVVEFHSRKVGTTDLAAVGLDQGPVYPANDVGPLSKARAADRTNVFTAELKHTYDTPDSNPTMSKGRDLCSSVTDVSSPDSSLSSDPGSGSISAGSGQVVDETPLPISDGATPPSPTGQGSTPHVPLPYRADFVYPGFAVEAANRKRGTFTCECDPQGCSHPQNSCDKGASGKEDVSRKVVSQHFGRNKAETKQIPIEYWVLWCRMHYQRASYNAKKPSLEAQRNWANIQVELILDQVERIETWSPGKRYHISLIKDAKDRLDREKTRLLNGKAPQLGPTVTASSKKVNENTDRTPMPFYVDLDRRGLLNGGTRSMAEVLELLEEIRVKINDTTLDPPFTSVPWVEFLPELETDIKAKPKFTHPEAAAERKRKREESEQLEESEVTEGFEQTEEMGETEEEEEEGETEEEETENSEEVDMEADDFGPSKSSRDRSFKMIRRA